MGRWIIRAQSAGPGTLSPAPVVNVHRDDRNIVLEMDFSETAWGLQFVLPRDGRATAGYRVQWWPDGASPAAMSSMGGCGGCAGACGASTNPDSLARTAVTVNHRFQIQPIANNAVYHVRVEKLNALGEICSLPTQLTINGGDATRVNALRSALTYLDDFNIPAGPADEKLWNHAYSTASDPRFKLFFVNDQYHAHTLIGSQTSGPGVGDRSQSAQRFRKPIAIQNGVRRRIVFDMDGAFGPRAGWYLDLLPVQADVAGHIDPFDSNGSKGLPAKGLRFKCSDQTFKVIRLGDDGAVNNLGEVVLSAAGRQLIPNVRRRFELMVGTADTQVIVDGRTVLTVNHGTTPPAPGRYEPLWTAFGYNTSKENNPYFLVHWDNFGFDGPVLEPRVTHNYVTQIAGLDYQKAVRWLNKRPTFTVNIPDNLQPTTTGATAEAWLVFTYQQGDYGTFKLLPTDHVLVNGTQYLLPPPVNNASPAIPDPVNSSRPSTVRIKLADLVRGGATAPLVPGNNTFQFYAEDTGICNLHVEVLYPSGSAPTYTPPARIHPFPMHGTLPKVGPPARFESIGAHAVEAWRGDLDDPAKFSPAVSGVTDFMVVAGNDPHPGALTKGTMSHPVASAEVWSTGGTSGIAWVEVYIRPKGSGTPAPGDLIARLTTARDAPAPQVRHAFSIDTTRFPNGEYEVFVLAESSAGLLSYPNYAKSSSRADVSQWSGMYYPLNIRIAN